MYNSINTSKWVVISEALSVSQLEERVQQFQDKFDAIEDQEKTLGSQYYHAVQKSVLSFLADDEVRQSLKRRGRNQADEAFEKIAKGVGGNAYKAACDVLLVDRRRDAYPQLHRNLPEEALTKMLQDVLDLSELKGGDDLTAKQKLNNLPFLWLLSTQYDKKEEVDLSDLDSVKSEIFSEEAINKLSQLDKVTWGDGLNNDSGWKKPKEEDEEDEEDDANNTAASTVSTPGAEDIMSAPVQDKKDIKGGTSGKTSLSDLNLDTVDGSDSVITKGSFNATTNMKQAFENNLTSLKGEVVQKGVKQVVDRMMKVSEENGFPFKIKSIEVQCTASTMPNRGPAAKLTFKELAQKRGELVKKLLDESDALKPPEKLLSPDYEGVKVVTDKYPVEIRGRTWKPNGDGTVGPKNPYQNISYNGNDINFHLSPKLRVGTSGRPQSNFKSPAQEDAMFQFKVFDYATKEQRAEVLKKAAQLDVVISDDVAGKQALQKLKQEIKGFQNSNKPFFQKTIGVVKPKGDLKTFFNIVKAVSYDMGEAYEDYITCYVIYNITGAKTDEKDPEPVPKRNYVVIPCCDVSYIPPQQACDGACDVREFT